MPASSKELTRLKSEGNWEEIYEVVRVITLYDELRSLTVRITILRYYMDSGFIYDAQYERQKPDGTWLKVNYGSILHGSESEDQAIRSAVSLVREAHR